ncbi:hypothetical protein NS506_02250 [Nocardia seriolae]|uniref:DNA-binding protein n=2 Tax=Nocardia seriolae TaxID=37332 RepID=A0ABC9Z813_9NOCA|nr:hypothetical protein NS506_02250 [Nocardia seriolae]BEK85826.1 hypothetical protein NSERKGN1266_17770 [Nocardia seriolae]GAM51520.1 DNA-binding protein [Nocardia seriolae]GAP33516.1 DNA-binding protein [Nocardia seriolae]
MERFLEWRNSVVGGDSERAIAARMGIGNNRVGRHLRESDPPVAETVIDFARAYGVNPVDGLVAAGLIAESEALRAAAHSPLRSASQMQLLDELVRRERERTRSAAPEPDEGADAASQKRKRWCRDATIAENLLS